MERSKVFPPISMDFGFLVKVVQQTPILYFLTGKIRKLFFHRGKFKKFFPGKIAVCDEMEYIFPR